MASTSPLNQFPTKLYKDVFPISERFPNLSVDKKWPQTADAVTSSISKRKKHPGSSGEVEINYNMTLRSWREGYHRNITDGDLIITISPELMDTSMNSVNALNLTDINLFLLEEYEKAMELYKTEIHNVNDQISNNKLEANYSLYGILRRTPTHRWEYVEEINSGHLDMTKKSLSLCYLTSTNIETYFNFYGFARGDIPDTALKTIAVARGNVIDSIKNYWGNDAFPGMNLYLIRKRVFTKGEYGPYAFVPYAGFHNPPAAHLTYVDITGHVQTASFIYVGKVIRWIEEFDYSPDVLDIMNGMKKPIIRTAIRSPGTLRIKMHSIPGLKTNFVI